MTLDDLKPGLRHSETLTVSEALAVPAQAQLFSPGADMPPVFATAQMIAFVEWTCVHALAPYLGPHQRTVGTKVETTHTAAKEPIGDGFHERMVIDNDRFTARLARKTGAL
jgi:fluoroacetyl-CoA thioesterase